MLHPAGTVRRLHVVAARSVVTRVVTASSEDLGVCRGTALIAGTYLGGRLPVRADHIPGEGGASGCQLVTFPGRGVAARYVVTTAVSVLSTSTQENATRRAW